MEIIATENDADGYQSKLEEIIEKGSKQFDATFSRYKYHVLRSALKSGATKKLSLVHDVKSKDGQLILKQGTAKTEESLRSYIGKLLKHQLEFPIEYYIDVIHPEAAQKIHAEMSRIAETLSQKGVCNFESMKETINAVVKNLSANHTLLNRLTVLKGEYVSGFDESLSVAILAASVGQEVGYQFEERVEAFTAGIFHHIGELPIQHMFGKGRIPYGEVKKSREHPISGYLILSSNEISENVKNAVLKHHLFLDGSGYPNGLTLTDDDELARLISITSSLITMCNRGNYSLQMALKLLDIYSRLQTRSGEEVTPMYDRSYYEVLLDLNLSAIESPKESVFHIQKIITLHNTYVKLRKINTELETLVDRVQTYVFENRVSIEAQEAFDTLLNCAYTMKNLTADTKVTIGIDRMVLKPELVSDLIIDLEVIITELSHYNSYFEKSIEDIRPIFENTPNVKIFKKAFQILTLIQHQLPKRLVETM
jgi:HD-GYP domain-containing protein (c-di-GMP phosphodiesterase class II)